MEQKLIGLREAARVSGIHQDYLRVLINRKTLSGVKVGRDWFLTEGELKKYLSTKRKKNGKIEEFLREREIRQEAIRTEDSGQVIGAKELQAGWKRELRMRVRPVETLLTARKENLSAILNEGRHDAFLKNFEVRYASLYKLPQNGYVSFIKSKIKNQNAKLALISIVLAAGIAAIGVKLGGQLQESALTSAPQNERVNLEALNTVTAIKPEELGKAFSDSLWAIANPALPEAEERLAAAKSSLSKSLAAVWEGSRSGTLKTGEAVLSAIRYPLSAKRGFAGIFGGARPFFSKLFIGADLKETLTLPVITPPDTEIAETPKEEKTKEPAPQVDVREIVREQLKEVTQIIERREVIAPADLSRIRGEVTEIVQIENNKIRAELASLSGDLFSVKGNLQTTTRVANAGVQMVTVSQKIDNLNSINIDNGATVRSGNLTVSAGSISVTGDISASATITGGSFIANISTATSTFAGGLIVDSDTFVVDAINNRVGIGTSSPFTALSIVGNIFATGSITGNGSTAISGDFTANGNTTLGDASGDSVTVNAGTLTFANTLSSLVANDAVNVWSLSTSTALAPIFSISTASTTSSGSGAVGIGTSTPFAKLSVQASTTAPALAVRQVDSGNQGPIASFFDGVAEILRLDSSGNLGVGTTSPSGQLAIEMGTSGYPLWIGDNGTSTPAFVVTGGSRVGIGTTSPWGLLSVNPNNIGSVPAFVVGSSTATNFVVSDSGRVGIGTTSPATALDIVQSANGEIVLRGRRITDVAPSGDLIRFTSADGATNLFRVDNSGNINAGGIISSGAQSILSTSQPQLRVQYDASNEVTFGVTSAGVTTFGFNGTTPSAVWTPQSNSVNTFSFTNAAGSSVLSLDTSNQRIGIGTSTPAWALQVNGTRPSFALSDSSASANLKHWLFSSMGGNLYVGTSTDAYGTSTPAALTISNAGNVGIGTAGPVSTLDIGVADSRWSGYGLHIGKDNGQGVMALTTAISSSAGSGISLEHYRGTHASKSALSVGDTLGYIDFAGYTNSIYSAAQILAQADTGWGSTGTDAPGRLTFWTTPDGSSTLAERMRIDSSGNVGIGTTSPRDGLAVVKDQEVMARFVRNASESELMIGLGTYVTGEGSEARIGANAFSVITGITNGATTIGATPAFRITPAVGAVGIGTTTPGGHLSVSVATTSPAFLLNQTSTGDLMTLQDSGSTVFTVKDGGNVGIGTTTPATTLSVQGNLLVSGNISSISSLTATSTITAANFVATGAAATSTLAGGLAIETSGFVYDYSSNNVGIGTANPGNTAASGLTVGKVLEIQSDNASQLNGIYLRRSDNAVGLDIVSDNLTTGQIYFDSRFDNADAGFLFRTRTAGTAVSALKIENNKVAVMSEAPGSTFSVNGNVSIGSNVSDAAPAGGLIASGAFGLGTTTPGGHLSVSAGTTSPLFLLNQTSTGDIATFQDNGSTVFTVKDGGNVGIGTTSPATTLSVQGHCVTGDTRLRRRRRKKRADGTWEDAWEEVAIKDIQAGDEILTLDEKIGALTASKVNALMDMGVKATFALTTSSGKKIRTTASHPYFVRQHTVLSGTFEVDQSGRIEDLNVPTFIAIANEDMADVIMLDQNFKRELQAFYKARGKAKFFAPITWARAVAFLVRKNAIARADLILDIEYTGYESLISQLLATYAPDLHVRYLSIGKRSAAHLAAHGAYRSHNRTNKKATEASVARVAKSDLHPETSSAIRSPLGRLLSFYSRRFDLSRGRWVKAGELNYGSDVLTADGWEKIISIKKVGNEQVYDIEVEGTHNFIGNDIVAHNTYITGGLGVGQVESTAGNITGTGRLSITSTAATSTFSTGGFTVGTSQFVVQQTSGNVGIGTAEPKELLAINGNTVIGNNDNVVALGAAASRFEVHENGNTLNTATLFRWGSGGAPTLSGVRSRSTTLGTPGTAVQSSDGLLVLTGQGDDGTNLDTTAAEIRFAVDGTVSSGVVPGRITFSTAPTSGIDAIAERMRITAAGNVGIGTTTPNWLLQVNGTRPSFALSDSSASANLKHWLFSSMGGNLYVGTSTDAYGTSTPAALTISNAGNVGIRTAVPGATLDIRSHTLGTTVLQAVNSSAVTILQLDNNTGQLAMYGTSPPTETPIYTFIGDLDTGFNRPAANQVELVTSGVSRLLINSSGNVGIGTTSPATTLSVQGNALISGNLTSISGITATSTITAANFVATGAAATSTLAGGLAIETSGFVYDYSSGNVGIGKAAPNAKLDIAAASGGNALQITNSAISGSGWVFYPTTNGTETNLDLGQYANGGGFSGTKVTFQSGGNLGIGTTSPATTLSVQGHCVTGDTRLRRRRRRNGKGKIDNGKDGDEMEKGKWKMENYPLSIFNSQFEYDEVRIDQIETGDEIASLDEKTGRIVWSKVNGLLDMGVKPIYKLTTASGKTIRTTGEHPYFVSTRNSVLNAVTSLPRQSFVLNWAMIPSRLAFWFSKVGGNALITILPGVFFGGKMAVFRKFVSPVRRTRRIVLDNSKTWGSAVPLSTDFISWPSALSHWIKRLFTFSSASSRILFDGFWNSRESLTSCAFSGILQGGSDMLTFQRREILQDFFDGLAAREHLQNLPNHNSRTLESRLAAADFRVGNDVFIEDYSLHSASYDTLIMPEVNPIRSKSPKATADVSFLHRTSNGVNSKNGKWTKVMYLHEGQYIAVASADEKAAVWDRIEKIEHLPEEQVYDIEVEGTHNFIGNDIVAHNTLISGNITSVANITATGTLALTGTTGTSTIASGQGFTIGTSQFVVQQTSGKIGIGVTTPTEPLTVFKDGYDEGVANTVYVSSLLNTAGTKGVFTGYRTDEQVGVLTGAGTTGGLAFFTHNGTAWGERMRIHTNGNLGIGTTTPNNLLQLANTGTAQLVLTDSDASSGTKHYYFRSNANQLELGKLNDALSTYGAGITFDFNGTNPGLGIGTTTPRTAGIGGGLASLIVDSASDTNIELSAATRPFLNFRSGATRPLTWSIIGANVAGNADGDVLHFRDSPGNIRLSLNQTGALGIGTTTPGGHLSVSVATTSPAFLLNQTSTGDILTLQDGGSTVFVVKDGGNVGIGTTTPATTLSVQGNLLVSGNINSISSLTATSTITAANFVATGAAATSTLAGGLAIETSGFVYDYSSGNVGIGTAGPSSPLTISKTWTDTGDTSSISITNPVQNTAIKSSEAGISINSTLSGSANLSSFHSINTLATLRQVTSGITGAKFAIDADNASAYTNTMRGLHITSNLTNYNNIATDWRGSDTLLTHNAAAKTLGTAYGSKISVTNSAGTISNWYGLYSDISNSGTITNTYGIYIDDVTSGTQTNQAYGLYQADTGARNYFGGNVGIGTTTPATTLSVQGNLLVSGNINSISSLTATSTITAANFVATGAAATSTLAGGLAIETSGFVYDYSSGNVGIGTATPNNLLSVYELVDFNNTDFNTKLGYQAGKNIVSGALSNTFIGYQAGFASTTASTNAADDNTAVGYQSFYSNTTGGNNSAFGYNTLYSNTTGYQNSAFGIQALYSNTTGAINSAFGVSSLYSNTTGNYNSTFGASSLYSNTTGGGNSAFGYVALNGNTTGNNNSAFGYQILYSNTTGYNNSASGYNALFSNTTGYNNSAYGYQAGYNTGVALQTNNSSVFIGNDANSSVDGLTNAIAIGSSAQATQSNQVVLGNTSITQTLLRGNVGIGTTSPGALLSLAGSSATANSRLLLSGIDTVYASSSTTTIPSAVNAYSFATSNTATPLLSFDTTNSRVGIGTTSPATTLSVQGNALISGNLNSVANITATGTLALTGTTGTSTIAGGLAIETSGFVYDYSSGSVGIGTTSPAGSAKLGVDGNVYISGGLGITQSITGICGNCLTMSGQFINDFSGAAIILRGANSSMNFNGGSGTFTIKDNTANSRNMTFLPYSAGGGFIGIGEGTTTPSGMLSIHAPSGTSTPALIINNAGTGDLINLGASGVEKMRLTNAGNLGIGTTTPGGLLSVSAAGTVPAFLLNQTSTGDLLTLQDGGTTAFRVLDGGQTRVGTTTPTGGLTGRFSVVSSEANEHTSTVQNNATNPGATVLYVDAPNTTSDAGGTALFRVRANGVDYFQINGGGAAILGGGSVGPIGNTSLRLIGTTTSANDYALRVQATAGTDRFVVRNDGNVGIGTTSPVSAFAVEGSGNLDFTVGTGGLVSVAGYSRSSHYLDIPQPQGIRIGTSTNVLNGSFGINIQGDGGDTVGISLRNTGTNGDEWILNSSADDSSGVFGGGTGMGGRLTLYQRSGNTYALTVDPNRRLGIGTTTPAWLLQVNGTRPSFALSDSSAGANLKHWLFSSMGGNLYVGTSTDAYGTSTPAALTISNAGNVGIGVSAPGAKIHSLATTEQLRLGYDATNYASFTTDSTGALTFGQNGSAFMVLDRPNATLRPIDAAGIDLGSATKYWSRLFVNGAVIAEGTNGLNLNASTTASANNTGQLIYVDGTIGEAASGNHSRLSGLQLAPPTVTGGAATVSDTATLYVQDAMTATVSGANYALWVDNGVSRFDGNVGIGTSTPNWLLQVNGTRPSFALSDSSAGANLKHWLFSSMGGNLYVGTSSDVYATSSTPMLTILSTGLVGIGTSTPSSQLSIEGRCVDTGAGCADIAELYSSSEPVEAGDIVAVDPENPGYVRKATTSRNAIGIVSSSPAMTIEGSSLQFLQGSRFVNNPFKPAVALAGKVPLKVSLEGGEIKPGDRITISSEAGIGMKATTSTYAVGIALKGFDGWTTMPDGTRVQSEHGEALVFVNLGYAHLDSALTSTDLTQTSTDCPQGSVSCPQGSVTMNAWSVDQTSGKVNVNFFGDVNLNGNNIVNVAQIVSQNGLWRLDDSGRLTAKYVETEHLTVGSSANPTGITLFDQTTKEPYCLSVNNGAVISLAGTCESAATQNQESGITNQGTTPTSEAISTTTPTTSTPVSEPASSTETASSSPPQISEENLGGQAPATAEPSSELTPVTQDAGTGGETASSTLDIITPAASMP